MTERSAELDAMLQATSRCLRDHLDALGNDRAGALPKAMLQHMRDLGVFGLMIPELHGGLGLDLWDACQIVAEIARFDRSLATCVGLHNGLGTWPLMTLGTEAQRERWLPRLASGESIAAFAATEARAGSDLASVTTHVEAVGEQLRLHGEKQYVTNGALADVFTVLARVRGAKRRYQLLCVPRDTPGLLVGAEEHKLGIRASSTTPVFFDDARLSPTCVLGEHGSGLRDAYGALAIGRAVMSAGCIGTARRALDETLAYVGTRRQFRRPIGVFGASRAHVAAMASRLLAMESLVQHVGVLHRAGESIESITTLTKVFCSEGAFEITDRTLQLHGAMGMMEDTGVALLARDCRVTRIFEGANDVLLVLLGSELLSKPHTSEARCVHSPQSPQAAQWLHVHQELDRTCAAIRKSLGVRVVERQDLLHMVARAHMSLVAASTAMTPGADPLAEFTASRWIREAAAQLAQHREADSQHDATFALTERLYAEGWTRTLEES